MDMAMNTPGLNMASATLVGYLRNPLLFAFTDEQEIEDLSAPIRPSIYTMKRGSYLLYMLLMVAIHISSLLLMEALLKHSFPPDGPTYLRLYPDHICIIWNL